MGLTRSSQRLAAAVKIPPSSARQQISKLFIKPPQTTSISTERSSSRLRSKKIRKAIISSSNSNNKYTKVIISINGKREGIIESITATPQSIKFTASSSPCGSNSAVALVTPDATPTTIPVVRKSTTTAKKKKRQTKLNYNLNTISSSSSSSFLSSSSQQQRPLLSLCDTEDLVEAKLLNRPSKRNRSPYVADVMLNAENRVAIAHVPNLDMGGKCSAGCTILLKVAKDRKGNPVGKDAVSAKYGTPKCEFITQLLLVDESYLGYKSPVWVGAHPSLGEKIAEQLIQHNLLGPGFPKVKNYRREVRNIAGTDMRADFVVEHYDETSNKPRVVEVKTVVDTDYMVGAAPKALSSETIKGKKKKKEKAKCVFVRPEKNYKRGAIFPWGNSNQKGPDGEKVVSARAIKHVRELTKIAQGVHVGVDDDDKGQKYDATILFIVIRSDAEYFRPNHEACPSFAKYLREAKLAGVQVLAKQVHWGTGGIGTTSLDHKKQQVIGNCYEGKLLDIHWPVTRNLVIP